MAASHFFYGSLRVDLPVICASVRVYDGARLPAAREFQEFP